MKELKDLAKALNSSLEKEDKFEKRLLLIYNVLYKAYTIGFGGINKKYIRIDEKFPLKKL